ncbi:extracellular solute-binding protein [Jatrophihabitans lederbergiae]|uniref:Extracellular solute-binding protein n=1 Tax=Jatrophihabitans lederbergiae TaxID=3075547 RepID=A0ABU2JAL3_9ACTN|nr:extracellular solute-binding protein [Jatrophihabitans sp. DSM 44399]MDT0262032.1 extracellular solute-binding protein [Jatrophihabitans sp. DSM 44399]
MPGPVSRRQFLAAGGGMTLAGLLAACSSPVATSFTGGQPSTADVIFWHLFGGGDGANMKLMVNAFEKSSHRSVESTLLPWGNPYYTKLALSASSGRPPDVAIAHLSRLPLLARAGLLAPVQDEGVTAAGITQDKFTPAAWSKATVNGKVYAVPLDTHPFVMFYNVDLAKKAGLLNAAGDALKPMHGRDDFVNALKAMKRAGAKYGAVSANTADPSTTWRWFMTLYSGLAGPIVSDQGTRVTIDQAALEETFAFMQSLTGSLALMPGNATPTTVGTLFGQGNAGFLFEGEWQIPTYRGVTLANGKPLNFNVVPFPAILGPKPVAYADSHSLVIPKSSGRSAQRTADAVDFIKGLLDNSSIWAEGGHIPAWLPVQRSKAFLKQKPQSNYIQAAFNAVYDPEAWYTGAGSDFQNAMGAVVTNVLAGAISPKNGVAAMTASLKSFSTARPPVQ